MTAEVTCGHQRWSNSRRQHRCAALQRIVCHLYKECLLSDTLLSLCLVSGVTQLQLVPAPERTPLDVSPSVLCVAGGRCADTLTTLVIRESSWDDGRLGLFVSAVAGRLATLDLCLCVNVSSSTIAAACAANRRTLRHLNVGWCSRPSLDGRALQHLAKCSQLETIVLSGHPLLETDDLRPLLTLPKLRALALKGTAVASAFGDGGLDSSRQITSAGCVVHRAGCTGITDLPTRLVTNLTSLNLGSVPLPASSLARILKGTRRGCVVLHGMNSLDVTVGFAATTHRHTSRHTSAETGGITAVATGCGRVSEFS